MGKKRTTARRKGVSRRRSKLRPHLTTPFIAEYIKEVCSTDDAASDSINNCNLILLENHFCLRASKSHAVVLALKLLSDLPKLQAILEMARTLRKPNFLHELISVIRIEQSIAFHDSTEGILGLPLPIVIYRTGFASSRNSSGVPPWSKRWRSRSSNTLGSAEFNQHFLELCKMGTYDGLPERKCLIAKSILDPLLKFLDEHFKHFRHTLESAADKRYSKIDKALSIEKGHFDLMAAVVNWRICLDESLSENYPLKKVGPLRFSGKDIQNRLYFL